jgi:hypothetical protein
MSDMSDMSDSSLGFNGICICSTIFLKGPHAQLQPPKLSTAGHSFPDIARLAVEILLVSTGNQAWIYIYIFISIIIYFYIILHIIYILYILNFIFILYIYIYIILLYYIAGKSTVLVRCFFERSTNVLY